MLKTKNNSLWADSLVRMKKNKASMVSAYFVLFVCLVAIFADFIAPFPFDEQNMDKILFKPDGVNILGTDSLGRDLFSRVVYGAKTSMIIGVLTSFISLVLGTIYGGISGWLGGWVDSIMMRFIDILYSIPGLVLLILVKVVFDSLNLFESNPEFRALSGMLLALSVLGWVTLARVVRGQVLQVKQRVYVEAARSLGARSPWMLFRHVFPNILGPIIVLLTFQIPANIMYESFLSFIGLGLQPPYSSWGVLANEGWRALRIFPHLILAPGLMIFFVVLAFNLFGDGLRDAFDPKLKK